MAGAPSGSSAPLVPEVGTHDSLYVSPHEDEAALSCAGRILWEKSRGLKILVVTLFGRAPSASFGEGKAGAGVTARLAMGQLAAGFPEASRRSAYYESYRSRAFGRHPTDEDCASGLAETLRDVATRTKARHIYLPLGVEAHIDHRLAHEAGMRVFQSGGGRNIFFYEERPAAFLPGAVRVRLAQLGARLPPEAEVRDGARLVRFLWRLHTAPFLRGALKGLAERLRCTRLAARQWREARGWRPHRAFGPGLQPVLHAVDPALLPAVRGAALAWAARPGRFAARKERLLSLSARYARRLGSAAHIERYWLLLPQRDADGLMLLPPAAAQDPLVV